MSLRCLLRIGVDTCDAGYIALVTFFFSPLCSFFNAQHAQEEKDRTVTNATPQFLIAVALRLERALGLDANVRRLGRGELGELGTQLPQMQPRHLLVQHLG